MSQERLCKNQVSPKSVRVMFFFCVDLTWNDPLLKSRGPDTFFFFDATPGNGRDAAPTHCAVPESLVLLSKCAAEQTSCNQLGACYN